MEKLEYMVVTAGGRIYYFPTAADAKSFADNKLRGRKYFFFWVFKYGETTPLYQWSY